MTTTDYPVSALRRERRSDTRNATYNRTTQRTQKTQLARRHTARARQSSGRHDRGRWRRHHLTSDRYSVRRIRCRVRRRHHRRSRVLRLRRRVHVRHRRSDLESIRQNESTDMTQHTTLTSAATAAEHGHLFQLRRHDRVRLAQDADQLTRLLRVVRREVRVRGTRHAGTLERPVSTCTHKNTLRDSLLYDQSGGCNPRSC